MENDVTVLDADLAACAAARGKSTWDDNDCKAAIAEKLGVGEFQLDKFVS